MTTPLIDHEIIIGGASDLWHYSEGPGPVSPLKNLGHIQSKNAHDSFH